MSCHDISRNIARKVIFSLTIARNDRCREMTSRASVCAF